MMSQHASHSKVGVGGNCECQNQRAGSCKLLVERGALHASTPMT